MAGYNFMISRAVDLVAKRLAGMDRETLARFTQTLSEEARNISDELRHSGQDVDAEILAARLDGVVKRLKYELRIKEPDSSPYEFPIFNVSHNANDVYPNPINHLYDKRYSSTYATFAKQILPAMSVTEQQSQSKPSTHDNAKPSPSSTQQHESIIDKYMPSLTRQKSQQQLNGPVNTQSAAVKPRRSSSSTRANLPLQLHPKPISISRTNSESEFSDSISKPNGTQIDRNKTTMITKRIYTTEDTVIGSETIEDLFEVINKHKSKSSESKPMTERIIIIDRSDATSSKSRQNVKPVKPSSTKPATIAPTTPTRVNSNTSFVTPASFTVQHTPFYNFQQQVYQQRVVYSPMANTTYYNPASFSTYGNSYYPYVYYTY